MLDGALHMLNAAQHCLQARMCDMEKEETSNIEKSRNNCAWTAISLTTFILSRMSQMCLRSVEECRVKVVPTPRPALCPLLQLRQKGCF